MNFRDYRERILLTSIAETLGYQVDLYKGGKTLEFKHLDGDTIKRITVAWTELIYYNQNFIFASSSRRG